VNNITGDTTVAKVIELLHYHDGTIFCFECYTGLGQYDDIVRMIVTVTIENSGTIFDVG